MASLSDGPLKKDLQEHKDESAGRLLQLLQTETVPKKKRARKELVVDEAPQELRKFKSADQGLLLDATLIALANEALGAGEATEPDPDALMPLIARVPCLPGYVERFVTRRDNQFNNIEALSVGELYDACEQALKVCNALATQSHCQDAALLAFGPVVMLLGRLVEGIEANSQSSDWARLEDLTTRTLLCMGIAGKEAELLEASAANNTDAPAASSIKSRWWLEWSAEVPCTDYASAAEVCAVAVLWRTITRCHLKNRVSIAALAAHAEYDMRLLGSAGTAAGYMTYAAKSGLDGVIDVAPARSRCSVAMYTASARLYVPETPVQYLVRILVARMAAEAAAEMLGEHSLSAKLLDAAASVVLYSETMEWLQTQPPSSIIVSALNALSAGGPAAVGAHLCYDVPAKTVRALAAAAGAFDKVSAETAAAGAHAVDHAGVDQSEADALLFYVSKDGEIEGLEWESDERGAEDDDSEGILQGLSHDMSDQDGEEGSDDESD